MKRSDMVAAEVDDIIENPMANYYDVLGINENEVKVLQMLNDSVSEYINVEAGVGGGFTNTNELRVMKYHEALNGPDGKKWKAKVKTEHGRMVKSGVFEKVNFSKLPSDAKDTQTRRSVSGYVVYLEDAPIMHRSATQKTVALSSCKAELNAAVLCAQDMRY
jgi:hypothetical protein